MSLLSESTHPPSTSFRALLDMKPVLSAKDTDTTPTMALKDNYDDTSSLQDLNDTNVVGTKTSSISEMPMVSTTDDDTGATVSMDHEDEPCEFGIIATNLLYGHLVEFGRSVVLYTRAVGLVTVRETHLINWQTRRISCHGGT